MMTKLSVNTSAVFFFLFALVLSSCSNQRTKNIKQAENLTSEEVWFKQSNLSLGRRIEIINSNYGLAISRGKGELNNGGEPGEALIFKNGEWKPIDSYAYSDFPIIKSIDSNNVWYLIHDNYIGNYKPRLFSYSQNHKKELPLPKIMWDEKDYSMWFSLSFTPSGKAFMVGQKGNIIFYDGAKWETVESPVKNEGEINVINGDLHDVFMISDSLGWAVGKGGIILKFEKDTWRIYESPVNVELNKICFVNKNTGWIVGERGTILKYENGNWINIETDFRVNFYSIKAVDENKVFIVGARSTLVELINEKWIENQNIKIFEDDFQDIDVITENEKDKIWVIGNDGIYTNTQTLKFSFTNITSQASLRNDGLGGIFFDYDEDDLPELFLLNENGPNILFQNYGKNSFGEVQTLIDQENQQFISQIEAIGDVNNDGYSDVLEIMDDLHFRLLFGEGGFDFTERRENFLKLDFIQSDPQSTLSSSFVDFNNDGNLDLYVSNYNSEDMLFKNDGTGNFENVYSSSGIKKFINHRSYGPVFSDFNNDNLIDVLITYRAAEKGKHISLFINKGNFHFTEKDDSTFYLGASPSTFSAIADDFNSDGNIDVLVYNSEERLKLLINNGEASFEDLGIQAGLPNYFLHPEPVNGILASADVNNDGWTDLFIGSKLYLNSPEFKFTEISEDVGINFSGNPTFADADNDGDMDLFLGSSRFSSGEGIRAAFYRNNLINGKFVKVKLNPDISNRSGIGSKIILKGYDSKQNLKYKTAKVVGLGASPMLQKNFTSTHFGLIDSLNYSLEIIFPSGIEQTINNVKPNSIIEVRESTFAAHVLILIAKSFNRSLLLINWSTEIIKFIFFVLIFTLIYSYGLKTKAKLYLKKWYPVPLVIIIYIFLIHINIENNQYISLLISYLIPVSLFLLFIKTGSNYIDKKESKFISHYKLIDILGVGGTGKVFKALDIHENKTVAVKVLNQQLLKDEENRKRLNSEGRLLSSMNHPNIVKVYEFGETEKHSFIAMEYLNGGTLEEYIENNFPINEEKIYEILLQICEGLKEIHSKNIIHRDVKSQNIMFDENNNIRIMDFGLSKSPLVSTMTSLGTVVGTLGYVAPEQVTNMYIDQRCDIFSLGVIIYQMITNKLPFTGENEIALIHSIFNTKPQNPSSINKNCSAELEALALKCIEKEPDNRFQNVDELIEEIKKINS